MKPGTKCRLIVVTIALLFSIAVLAFLLRPDPEPSYNGKTLTQWLDEYWVASQPQRVPISEKQKHEYEEAIRQIGTNGIPTLLRLTATRNSAAMRLAWKFPSGVARKLGFEASLRRYATGATVSPLRAQIGFEVLGASASNAIPDLIQILRTSDNYVSRRAAIYSLSCIGPAATVAIPDLVRTMKDPVEVVRVTSAFSISRIACPNHEWRPQALPGLISAASESLKNPIADVDSHLLLFGLLESIGPDAKAAVPEIIPFLSHPNYKDAARRALEKIDPSNPALK